MTTLVTGASGFVGRHLLDLLVASPTGPIVALGRDIVMDAARWPGVAWQGLEITDGDAVRALIARVQPARVYHLAGRASVAASFEDPALTFATNGLGTVNLLDALRRYAPSSRTLLVSSGEVYGPQSGAAIGEDAAFLPANPYAASKAAAEMAAIATGLAHGLQIVRARAFNHAGPGQAPTFVLPNFARQIAMIEVGDRPGALHVGNLAARRDFLDVRDVVSGYTTLMAKGQPGRAYNVCSGQAVAISKLLDGLLALAKVGIDIVPDPERFRPLDAAELRGDPTALIGVGWQPTHNLDTMLSDLLAEWRHRTPFRGDFVDPRFA